MYEALNIDKKISRPAKPPRQLVAWRGRAGTGGGGRRGATEGWTPTEGGGASRTRGCGVPSARRAAQPCGRDPQVALGSIVTP
jgi:hypothetical protein